MIHLCISKRRGDDSNSNSHLITFGDGQPNSISDLQFSLNGNQDVQVRDSGELVYVTSREEEEEEGTVS
jgi:hypothetical protein